MIPLTTLLVLMLSTWRLSSLFANEDGPLNLFKTIRTRSGVECPANSDCFGKTWFAKGILCEWCNSVWFGTLLTLLYVVLGDTAILIILPLALSAMAILIKYLIERLMRSQSSGG